MVRYSISTVICSSTRALRGRKLTPDGGADMAPGVAKDFHKQVGGSVDDLWRAEMSVGVDVAVDADDALDGLKRPEVFLENCKLDQCAQSRCTAGLLDARAGTGNGPVFVG